MRSLGSLLTSLYISFPTNPKIGHKGRRSGKHHSFLVDFAGYRPVTRSKTRDLNNLVSKPEVMGDFSNTLQAQFKAYMKMYQEHRHHDELEREHLSARIEELSREMTATRVETHQGDDNSANWGPRE